MNSVTEQEQEFDAMAQPPMLSGHQASTTALVLDAEAFASVERFANMMASGKTTLPAHFRGNPADCAAVIIQAMQWKMNPFAVAQKTHLVNGQLGYEAQLVSSVVNNSGLTTGRLNCERFGPWERVLGKSVVRKNEHGKEYRVPNWSLADEEGCGVRVWATLKGESEPRVLTLLLTQAAVRNSTLWASDPVQQLTYLAQKRWARLHAADAMMGVYTPDELEQSRAGERELNPIRPKSAAAQAEAARTKGDDTQERAALVAKLEEIARTGNMAALSKEWEGLGKANRKIVGGEDWARIKDLAELSEPTAQGEATPVDMGEEGGDDGRD